MDTTFPLASPDVIEELMRRSNPLGRYPNVPPPQVPTPQLGGAPQLGRQAIASAAPTPATLGNDPNAPKPPVLADSAKYSLPDPHDPKYRMGLGTRILGSIGNALTGFATKGSGPVTYVGPGATNSQYERDLKQSQLGMDRAKEQATIESEQALTRQRDREKPSKFSIQNTDEGIVGVDPETMEAKPATMGGQPLQRPQQGATDPFKLWQQQNPGHPVSEYFDLQQQSKPDKEAGRDDKAIAIMQKPANQRTPDEVSYLNAYQQWVKQTKVDPGVIRMQVLGDTRQYPAIDTQTGQATFANPNAMNREPGRFAPAGQGSKAMGQRALIEDIRGNIQSVRQSLQNPRMPEFTPQQRATMAFALGSHDPVSALDAAMRGGALGSLTPEQQDYLISNAQLVENAMAMRSVLGAGQGSDQLRTAIRATIPGPQTPDKRYAMKQLDAFENVLNRLEKGIPNVPLAGGGGQQGGGVIFARDPQGNLHQAPAGTALPKGWKLEQGQ